MLAEIIQFFFIGLKIFTTNIVSFFFHLSMQEMNSDGQNNQMFFLKATEGTQLKPVYPLFVAFSFGGVPSEVFPCKICAFAQ